MGAYKKADGLAYPPRAMRAERAAAYLDIGLSTFLRFVEQKRLPAGKKLGGVMFWDRQDLDVFVATYEGEQNEDGKAGARQLEELLGGHHARHGKG